MKLAKICTALLFGLSSISFSYTPLQNTAECVSAINENEDYTIVREYHNGLWWLVYYDVDGMKVMEVPDPWQ